MAPQLINPLTAGTGSSAAAAQSNPTADWLKVGTQAIGLAAKLAPLLLVKRGGYISYHADGDGVDSDDALTLQDLGVLSDRGNVLPPSISGPERGSPAGLPQQADEMSNLQRVRERFRPMLENDPRLRRAFDVNTTAEVGTNPARRDFYQALTLDRAAARGESLPYTLSRGPGTPDRYYPGTTMNARAASGQGVNPALWAGYNPAGYGTGNASRDPITGRDVGFGGGPQTGSAGGERGGIERDTLPATRRFGYQGPSTTPIGFRSGAPQGTKDALSAYAQATDGDATSAKIVDAGGKPDEDTRPATRSSAERSGSMQPSLKTPDVVPAMAKPPKTFAQNLAANPFWQLGTALLQNPGKSPYFGPNLGAAMGQMNALQTAQRKQDLLEAEPSQITLPNGELAHVMPNGRVVKSGLFTQEGTSKAAAQRRAEESHTIDINTPKEMTTEKRGPFGITTTTKTPYTIDPDTGKIRPFTIEPPEPPAPKPSSAAPATSSTAQAEPPATTTIPGPKPTQTAGAEPPSAEGESSTLGTKPAVQLERTKPPQQAPSPVLPTPSQQEPQLATQPAQAAAGPSPAPQAKQPPKEEPIKPIGTLTNPQPRNEEYLDSLGLTEQEKQQIRDIVDYKSANKFSSKVIPGAGISLRDHVNGIARNYDPSYQEQRFNSVGQTIKEFSTGKQAQNLQSNNMVLRHLGDAMTAVERLGNFTYMPGIANPANAAIRGQIDPKYQEARSVFMAAADAAAVEAAKTFRGAGAMSQQEAAAWKVILADPNASPVTLRAALKTVTGLVMGRVEAAADTYNAAMGPNYARNGQSFMSGKANETVQRAMAGDAQEAMPPSQYGFEQAGGKKTTGAGGGPKIGDTRDIDGKPYFFDGTGWLPGRPQ